ncbi:MAG TPA: TonB-dependent receptor [Woeseiaceae bacterium]|nr:TonB-dependent receptor [Woeseiaceae bacterium]
MRSRKSRLAAARPVCSFLFLLLALALAAGVARAQIEGATVRGRVMSAEGPRAGVPVVAIHLPTGQVRRATTGRDGRYVMVDLRPGEYEVQVAEAAFEPQQLTLRVGQTATVDFSVQGGPDAGIEEIIVTGTQVELFEGGAVGTSVTPELIDRLPQINRNFLSFADLAPGVQFVREPNGGTFIRGGAQHQRTVNVFIDGVSQKDYVLKGGVTGQDSSRGNPFPQSAIAEYQVITQNYKAEYAQVSSAAISAVTASGTNEFRGSVFYDFTNEDLRAETPLEKIEGEKVASEQQQYGFTVSGPIVRDQLFFLLAFEGKDNEDPVDVIPGGGFDPEDLPPEFAELTGREVSEFEEDLLFAKIDWNPSEAHQFEASLKYRDESAIQGFGNGIEALPFATSVDQEDIRFQAEYTYVTDAWQNELRITWEDSTWSPNPLTTGVGTFLQNAAGEGVLRTGAGENFQEKGQDGWGIQNDFTLLDLEWLGGHTIKAGISYKKLTLKSLQQLPANPQFFWNVEFNGPGTFALVQPFRLDFGQPLSDLAGAIEADNEQWGIFIQDDWYVTDRLTLNIGVRWDYEETPVYKDRVTPPEQVEALRNWPNINNDVVNYDIDDWISTGDNRDYDSDNIAPRFGFSWDVSDAHTIYGGWGRSYDRNQFDFIQLETTNATFGRGTLFFQGDPDNPCAGPNCIPWDPDFLTPEGLDALIAGASAEGGFQQIFLLPNDLETPYSDQYSVGLRSAWPGDWETDLAYSHIESKDGFVWMLGNRLPDGSFFPPGAIFGAPFGFPPPGFGNLLLGRNGTETESDSIFLKAERPHLDDWGISIAYTWTDATENRIFSDNFALDYPSLEDYGSNDSVGIAEHRIVIAGTYDLPWDLLLSARFIADSGVKYQYLDCLAGPDQCVFRRIDPDDAEFRQLDLALEKRFSFGFLPEESTFRVRLDVLNVFNRRNWTSFDLFPGDVNGVNPNFGAHQDSIDIPRTAKLTVGFDW